MNQLQEAIVKAVESEASIKGVNLVLKVIGEIHPRSFSNEEFFEAVESLVKDGKILELEYIVPSYPDRIKMVYFPAGTTFNVEGLTNATIEGRVLPKVAT